MKVFRNRAFLAVVFGIGGSGILCLLGITFLCFADHRSVPWPLWLGGFQWGWCTWLAGKRLFTRKAFKPGQPTVPFRR